MPASFRKDYLTYDELTAVLKGWEKAHPDVCSLRSIGRSEQGRELWLLTLGPEPDRVRPAVWVDGNMHAGELCRLERRARDRRGRAPAAPRAARPCTTCPTPRAASALRDVRFYVLPRMSPDGAEAVLDTRALRALGAARRTTDAAQAALDARGRRRRRPRAAHARSAIRRASSSSRPRCPACCCRARIEDAGPVLQGLPRGRDRELRRRARPRSVLPLRQRAPTSTATSRGRWAPEHEQVGAGRVSRAASPRVARGRRVPSRAPRDLRVAQPPHVRRRVHPPARPRARRQDGPRGPRASSASSSSGARSSPAIRRCRGFEEFLYEPEKPLHGDLTDYAYHQRGCIAYVVRALGPVPAARHRAQEAVRRPLRAPHARRTGGARRSGTRAQRAAACSGRGAPCEHPQLGAVEVGGVDRRFGIWNPPRDEIDGVCNAQSAVFLRVAALLPRLELEDVSVESSRPA